MVVVVVVVVGGGVVVVNWDSSLVYGLVNSIR